MPLNVATGGVVLAIIVILLLFSAVKILREYDRGVVFFLGRYQAVKGPGLVIIIPGIQKMIKVSLRTITMDVPPQEVITRDNVSVRVNAVVYFRVVTPDKAIIAVENRPPRGEPGVEGDEAEGEGDDRPDAHLQQPDAA